MDIIQAKQQVKEAVIAYLAQDDLGFARIPPEEQRPVFLLGAPGIGKTAIVAQVAHELGIGLVSYSMTHHTRQSALGLPLIVRKEYRGGSSFDVSEYTMSEIIASVYDYMEDTGVDKGILFLDEINCVSETLYPSMLQFLQFKTFGRHKVPEGWIVVCAGNPPEYNRNVHEFDIVTLDRLRRVEIEPSIEAWKTFMRSHKAHPAIATYLELRQDDFYVVESSPSGKQFVSARSWSELSRVVSLHEDLDLSIDEELIEQYVQHPEVAARFASYYELFSKYRGDYQVDAILTNTASDEIAGRAANAPFDERLALVSLVLEALENDMEKLIERLTTLNTVREVLRSVNESANSEAFGVALRQYATQERERSVRAIDANEARTSRAAASLLEHLALEGSFDSARQRYRGNLSELEVVVNATRDKLENAFAFFEQVFGIGPEVLIFITELTSRHDPAQFIAQFGSEGYFKYSGMLSTETERDAIFEEIDALEQA